MDMFIKRVASLRRCWLAVPLLLAAAGAQAGIGIGTQPDYPTPVSVGQTGLFVTLGFQNTSFGAQATGPITIFPGGIKHNPSCGSSTSPCTSPDLGVFALSATGVGLGEDDGMGLTAAQSICNNINFDVSAPDGVTGEVTITPNPAGNIDLLVGEACFIGFTVDVLKVPTIDTNLVAAGTQTLQTSAVSATHSGTATSGTGTGQDETTVFDCSVSITKCVVVDTNNDGSLEDETCADEATGIFDATAEWRIVVTDEGPGELSDCSLVDETLGIDQSISFTDSQFSIEVPGTCDAAETNNTATVTCNACDGNSDLNEDSASATLLCEECDVEVDKQISCDGGTTWHDQGLVQDQSADAADECMALGDEPIMVRYVVNNPNTACDLSNCALTETNPTFGTEPSVGDLASGQGSGTLDGELTPLCDDAYGDEQNPNEPNLITVDCDTEYGTTVTANDDAVFSCLDVDVLVDRNVDCGSGAADMELVRANDDGTNGCTTLDGNNVNWGYQVQNVGTATLYACTLTDANSTVSDPITVGTLAGNGSVIPYDATNNPVPCSDELEASEVDPGGQVTLECCIQDVASLGECDISDQVSVFDRSTVTCNSQSGLNIVKECVDEDADGADESVKVTVSATDGDLGFTDCTVTDTFHPDVACADLDGGGTDVPLTPAGPYALDPSGEQISTGTLPEFSGASCNTASVTCLDGASQEVTENAIPVECTPPVLGCITRTPGFWGNRPDITDNYLPLEVCGVTLDNVDVDDDHSAIEAICSVGRDHRINGETITQLVRQCTAAALNFAVSADEDGSCESNPSDGSTIGTVFDACCSADSACTGNETTYTANECIGLIDYFNNDSDTLATGVFSSLGAADSSTCRDSRNNGVVVTPQ